MLLEKTEGNPLFVEETVRMLVEQGEGAAVRIPDTLQALIAARIDTLPPASRSVLRHGALIGRVFWRGAILELDPSLDVDAALSDLVDRQLLTREPLSTLTGEVAFRFRHVLIRDVAYGGLAKSVRATLHRTFAEWLRGRSHDELVETQAFHLERAAALFAELDGRVPDDLRAEAADALGRAGRRALEREANRRARRLLLRAIELEPSLDRRFCAARAAWRLWELPAASVEMEAVREQAREAGDRTIEGLALVQIAEIALNRNADVTQARELGREALELLAAAPGDARSEALTLLSGVGWWEGDLDERRALHGRGARDRAGGRAGGPREPRTVGARGGPPRPARAGQGRGGQRRRLGARGVERQPLGRRLGGPRSRLDPPAPRTLRGGRRRLPDVARLLRRDRRDAGRSANAAARGRRRLAGAAIPIAPSSSSARPCARCCRSRSGRR